jgi:hypothetical protein
MSRLRMITGSVVCFSIAVFMGQALSQTSRARRPASRPDLERMRDMNPEEKFRYLRKRAEEQEAQAMKQALGVDEQQWKVIKPKLKKVQDCRDQAFVGIGLPFQSSFTSSAAPAPGQAGGQGFGSFSGGFQFQSGGAVVHSSSPWERFDRPPTEGEKICEELQLLLQDPEARPEEIMLKMDALRKARERARKQWAQAQQELRKVLSLRQEAALLMMGLFN